MEVQVANLADALKTVQFSQDGILTRVEYGSVLKEATSLPIPKSVYPFPNGLIWTTPIV